MVSNTRSGYSLFNFCFKITDFENYRIIYAQKCKHVSSDHNKIMVHDLG